jgi:tetratricopeptide (TPR) repeat protein
MMNADDLYHSGREAMEAGTLEDAIRLFRQSVAEWPHFKTLELLGECLLRLERPREAIIPLAAATALNQQGHARPDAPGPRFSGAWNLPRCV